MFSWNLFCLFCVVQLAHLAQFQLLDEGSTSQGAEEENYVKMAAVILMT